MAELYGVHDELPADIADVVLDDVKPVNDETQDTEDDE